jgi:hypothetical protein
MASRRGTSGDGEPYDAEDEAELERWLDRAMRDARDLQGASLDVTAVIEWGGTVDITTRMGPEGMRRTRLDGLDLTGVKAATDRASAAGQAEYGRSYDAQGWHAKLAQLTGTSRGRDAAGAAGLNPSRTTFLRWLTGTQAPNRSNRDAIERAYEDVRRQTAEAQRVKAVRGGRHEVATALTAALRAEYGVNIRFRNIRDMRIR